MRPPDHRPTNPAPHPPATFFWLTFLATIATAAILVVFGMIDLVRNDNHITLVAGAVLYVVAGPLAMLIDWLESR